MHLAGVQQDLRAILDSLAVGVVRVDSNWTILYRNASAGACGLNSDSSVGCDFWSTSPDIPATDSRKRRFVASEPVSSSHFTSGDRWLRMDIGSIDEGGRVIQIFEVSADLKAEVEREARKRKEAENALEAQQQFLQAVLDNVEAGIVACDENGTLKLFNHAARAFHGLEESPIPAEQWSTQYDLYYPDGVTPLRKQDLPLYRAFSGEVVRNVEIVIAPPQGKRRTLRASGRALVGREGQNLGAVLAMQDITHRKISGSRLRAALRQFRTLFNDAPIAYHEIDREGVIRRVNRAECRLLEFRRQDLIGRPMWNLVPEEERERHRAETLKKIAGLLPLKSVELEYLTASGRRFVVQTFENFIHDSAGGITGIRTAILDVTDRKDREQAEAAVAEISSILERIGDAYIALDKDWRYTYVNKRAAELALKPASELLGRSVWEEFPEAVHTPFSPNSNEQCGNRSPSSSTTISNPWESGSRMLCIPVRQEWDLVPRCHREGAHATRVRKERLGTRT